MLLITLASVLFESVLLIFFFKSVSSPNTVTWGSFGKKSHDFSQTSLVLQLCLFLVCITTKLKPTTTLLHISVFCNCECSTGRKSAKRFYSYLCFFQGFGSFNGFVATMYVCYLLSQKVLNHSMNSYQVLRHTLTSLSEYCLCFLSLTVIYWRQTLMLLTDQINHKLLMHL